MSTELDPKKVLLTIQTLERRIEERFPSSGLGDVCRQLLAVCNACKEKAEWIARPNYFLRAGIALVILLSIIILAYGIPKIEVSVDGRIAVGELVQVVDAALNNLVLLGAAIFFLVTFEVRIKRNRALNALHELRTIVHVIDMHQLTKDPGKLTEEVIYTPSSPKSEMTSYELMRYLDYCSEMLSLTGKIAALYGQSFHDSVVVVAVNDIENLTTGLARKIWQKIMIIHLLNDGPERKSLLDSG